jgi:hypothetical protein
MQAYVRHYTTAPAALPDRLLGEIQGLKGGLKTTFCHLSTHPQFATNLKRTFASNIQQAGSGRLQPFVRPGLRRVLLRWRTDLLSAR